MYIYSYICPPNQVFCHDGQHSSMATMWLQTPEESVKSLFHEQPGQ